MQYTFKYRSPLGGITIAADDEGLTGLWFDGQKYFADTLSARHEEKMLPVFGQVREWLDCYFGGGIPGFTPPVHLQGSPFRLAVWDVLRQIPYGETASTSRPRRASGASCSMARGTVPETFGGTAHWASSFRHAASRAASSAASSDAVRLMFSTTLGFSFFKTGST